MMINEISSICPAPGWQGGFFDRKGEVYLAPVACWAVINGEVRGVFSEGSGGQGLFVNLDEDPIANLGEELTTGFGSDFYVEDGEMTNFLGYIGPGKKIPDHWRTIVKDIFNAGAEFNIFYFFGEEKQILHSIFERYARGEPISAISEDFNLTELNVFKYLGKRPRAYLEARKAREKCLQESK